jgi:hypothetical protein
MKKISLRNVAPSSRVNLYRLFRGTCCLHHQGDHPDDENNPEGGGDKFFKKRLLPPARLHGITTQKTTI